MRNLESIRLIVLDVDGTMTDGGIYIDNNGIEQKKFNIKDGAGIILAESNGHADTPTKCIAGKSFRSSPIYAIFSAKRALFRAKSFK